MNPDDIPPATGKPSLRRWARMQRARVAARMSADLAQRLRSLPEMQAARDILIYLCIAGEVDIEALAEDETRRWYVPRCIPDYRLAIHRYLPGETDLRRGAFGIREPDPVFTPETDPALLDMVILPALLLSETGDRLGYGGGYYDRLLLRLSPGCITVGVLPERLVLPALPRDPWDRPLSVIVTENRILRPEPHAPT